MPSKSKGASPASKAPRAEASVQTPLETYLREINETALLTASDEKELAGKIADGDVRARDRMVRAVHVLHFVIVPVLHLFHDGVDFLNHLRIVLYEQCVPLREPVAPRVLGIRGNSVFRRTCDRDATDTLSQ